MSFHLPRPRTAVALSAALAAAMAAYASFVRVPAGRVAVIGSVGGGSSLVTGPDWRFLNPISERAVILPGGELRVRGDVEWVSPEGATLRRRYGFTLDAGRADPAVLLRDAADGELEAAARRALEAVLLDGAPPVEVALETRLAAYGILPGSLDLDVPIAGAGEAADPLADLRASFKGPPHPVLIVGIDSADWAVMDPMIENGELPALAALRERGAWGTLRSMQPALSPLLWTTVATGKTPDQHGIVDFLTEDAGSGRQVPISSRHRRVKALWSILTDLGQRSLTVGWWATWPAERVDGVMITDRVAYSLFAGGAAPDLAGAVYPPEAATELAPLVVRPEAVSLDELREIIDLSGTEYRRARAGLKQVASYSDPVSHLFRILAATRTYHAMALRELRSGQPPLSMIYYEGLDEVNHRFAQCAPPAMRKWCAGERAAAFGGAVENFYRLQDRLVGELVEAAAPDTVVLVVSDHGFAWGDARPTDVPPDIEGKPGRWHTLDGVLIAAGPSIRPGRLPVDPQLLDVAPTVLALLGLPRASDMSGTPMAGVAAQAGVPALLATYETPGRAGPSDEPPDESPADAEMLAKLTALGYLGGSEDGDLSTGHTAKPAGPAAATVTGHLNTANALMARGEYASAEPRYRQALELAPRFFPARLGLAQCLVATGRAPEGWKELEAAMMDGEDLDAGIYMKVARYLRDRGRSREGADLFARLPRRQGLEAARLSARGVLLAAGGREAEAESALRGSLEIEPAQGEALQAMYDLLSRRGEREDLAAILERALKARPGSVLAVNFLALTRERMGRAEEAERLLREQLGRSPRDVATLTNLAGVLMRRGDDRGALPLLEKVREVNPQDVAGIVNLIVLQGRLGDLEAARGTYRSAGPRAGAVAVLNAMAYACFVNGAREEAIRLLDRSLAQSPDQKEARRLREAIDAAAGNSPSSAGEPGL